MERNNTVVYAVIVLMAGGLILNSMYYEKKVDKTEELIQQSYEEIEVLRWQKAELINEIEFLDSALRVFDFKYSQVYIRPNDPEIQSLAAAMGDPETAYYFVRDNIAYDVGSLNYMAPAVLQVGKGDCTAKSNLLASLLRAEGVSEDDVYVVLGTVAHEEEPYTHAWVEFYDDGKWRVLDASAYPSVYTFNEWDRESFYEHFAAVNWIEYNDKYSTIVEKVDPDQP
jgi:transglutaminase-like putative cysteine protease